MAKLQKPDLEQAKRFLRILDPEADCRSLIDGEPDGFTFQTFDDVKGRKDRLLAKTLHGDFDALADSLVQFNARKAGVFVTINRTDLKGRKLANLVAVRAIWIDDDDGLDIPTPIEPHLVVETSPGKSHRIYLVDNISQEEHLRLQEILIAKYGSDENVKDVVRVLRIPGFYHCKGEPFMVRLIHESGDRPYTAEQLIAAFPPEDSHVPAKKATVATSTELAVYGDDYVPLSEEDALNGPLPDINASNAYQYLPEPGEQSRNEWLRIGLILHHQFSGSEEGLALFDQWSQNVRAYEGFDDVATSWNSFGKRQTGPIVTFRTLIQEHKKLQALKKTSEDLNSIEKAHAILAACEDHLELTRDVAPVLWKLADKNVALEEDFCRLLRVRFSELNPGNSLSLTGAKRAMRMRHTDKKQNDTPDAATATGGAPAWAKDWVWISSEEVFFNVETGVKLTTRGFSGHYDSKLPKGDGAPLSASAFVRDNYYVPKVMSSMYMPSCEMFFFYDGISCVNTYSDKHRCPVPDDLSDPDDRAAAKLFKSHVMKVCGGWNREAQLLCNFLAMSVHAPPLKVRWAPLLVGTYGDGKSLFYTLISKALGANHTRTIRGSTIAASAKSSFTGWAGGHCFGFIEEVKWHGHNRYEIVNSIKDVITNDVIDLHKKHQEGQNSHNAANYFLTTNFVDAVPMEIGDRRYFVLHSQFPLIETQASDPDYFKKLHCAIYHNAGGIVRWLLDLEVHAEFDKDGHAPMTEAKQNVIRLTTDDFSEVVREVIEDDDDPLYSPEVVCFNPLLNRLIAQFAGSFTRDQEYKLSKALVTLGYLKLDRARIEGDRQSLWAKKSGDKLPTMESAKAHVTARLKKREDKEGPL